MSGLLASFAIASVSHTKAVANLQDNWCRTIWQECKAPPVNALHGHALSLQLISLGFGLRIPSFVKLQTPKTPFQYGCPAGMQRGLSMDACSGAVWSCRALSGPASYARVESLQAAMYMHATEAVMVTCGCRQPNVMRRCSIQAAVLRGSSANSKVASLLCTHACCSSAHNAGVRWHQQGM